jgi:hypothetical protein
MAFLISSAGRRRRSTVSREYWAGLHWVDERLGLLLGDTATVVVSSDFNGFFTTDAAKKGPVLCAFWGSR